MTKFNLTQIWKRNIQNNLKKKLKLSEKRKTINDKIIQASFKFEKSPKIIFVKDLKNLEPIKNYKDLSKIPLTKKEQQIVNETKKNIIKKGGYDGNQLLITHVLYDDDKNEVYLKSVQAKYSLLRALALKKFDQNSKLYKISLYKTGVLVVPITKDESILFLERKRDKFYSVPSGFMEAKTGEQSLENLALNTAKEELEEEIFGDTMDKNRDNFLKQFAKNLKIEGVSIRKIVNGNIGTIEFVAINELPLNKEYLKYIAKNNTSKDAKEHTGNCFLVSSEQCGETRKKAITKLTKGYTEIKIPHLPKQKEHSGWFLYGPILNIFGNRNLSSIFLKKPSDFVPMKFLKNPPVKTLTWVEKNQKNKNISKKILPRTTL